MKICKILFGSYLYGTNNENSDKDYKGIFLPDWKGCVLNKIPNSFNFTTGSNDSKNSKDDVDEEIYSLQYFIKLACEGQTVALDMLHCNDECLIETSDVWEEIVRHRKKFYTKNLSAFVGYARTQSLKYGIKGERILAIDEVLKFLKSQDHDKKLIEISDSLPLINYTRFTNNDEHTLYEVCGKQFHLTVKVGYVIPILEKIYNEYGSRAQSAKENKGIDWKAFSHAIRSAYQVKEILQTNDLIFPLKECKIIKSVKEGRVDYLTEAAPLLDSLMDEVESLIKTSELPMKVDKKFWDNFIVEVYKEKIK